MERSRKNISASVEIFALLARRFSVEAEAVRHTGVIQSIFLWKTGFGTFWWIR
jgi:hypothetical protein